ncbi:MAG: hypothetical protein V4717_03555 [Bacteroidota bacterium]
MTRFYTLINKINTWFWSRVVASSHSNIRSLNVFRIILGLFLLLFYSPNYGWIGKAPKVFFNPPLLSLGIFLDKFPSTTFFQILDILILLCTLFIITGIKAKISSLSYGILNIIGLTFQFSFGKIDHTIFIYVMLICLAFSGWGTELALVPDKKPNSEAPQKSFSLIAVLLCFAFFTAGFNKAFHWLNFDTSKNGTGFWLYQGWINLGREYLLVGFVKTLPFWLLKVLDFFAVIFELTPLFFLLYSRKAWHTWLLVAGVFHFTSLFILNITFLIHIIIYLAFFDFSIIYDQAKNIISKKGFQVAAFIFLAAVFLVRIYDVFNINLSSFLFLPDANILPNLVAAMIVWIFAIMLLFRNAFLTPPGQRFYK